MEKKRAFVAEVFIYRAEDGSLWVYPEEKKDLSLAKLSRLEYCTRVVCLYEAYRQVHHGGVCEEYLDEPNQFPFAL